MTSASSDANGFTRKIFSEEQRAKINEVKASIAQLPEKLSLYSSDASIARYLVARHWNVKKATKMIKETLKWRIQYKPEEIRWDEVAHEAETGKIYRATYSDKYGRSVLVMRPGFQNTKSTKGQIRYLVYCMENAILNLPSDQEQMVWLIDFKGFNMSSLSLKAAKETADVLQNHYPERLGIAILYNPPKLFEPFWNVVKPFLEQETCRKVKFVYSDDNSTKKIIEDLFDTDEIDSAFGGNKQIGFHINDYAAMMREDDQKMLFFWSQTSASSSADTLNGTMSKLSIITSESDAKGTSYELDIKSEENGASNDTINIQRTGITI